MCGVSTQTVSRVINKRPDVSVATRTAVEAAIASVGFQPSAVARSLVQRRSQTLGVIAAGLHFFGVAQTLNGIAEASEEAGYALLLKEVDGAGEVDILPVMDFFIGQRVDGIIFAAPDVGRNLSASLPAASPPMIFLKSDHSTGLPTIAIDNLGGARLATEHLIGLGRRRIAHVAGPLSWLEARDRRDAWLESLACSRAPARPRGVRQLDLRQRHGGLRGGAGAGPRHRRGLRRQRPDGTRRAPPLARSWHRRAG